VFQVRILAGVVRELSQRLGCSEPTFDEGRHGRVLPFFGVRDGHVQDT